MLTLYRRPSRLPAYVAIALFMVLLWYLGRPAYDTYVRFNGVHFHKSSIDWSKHVARYPVESLRPLPADAPRKLPAVQHDFETTASSSKDGAAKDESNRADPRREAVLQAFKKSWSAYTIHAWMRDELKPVTGGGKTAFGGYAATLVDALDTLWIMDLKTDFRKAVKAVATIDWDATEEHSLNLFETTIRHLGGLLSAYDLSSEPVLLAKALELGNMLFAAFDTPNHLPPFWLTFKDAMAGTQQAEDHQSSAAGCSLSMEFTRLAQLTGEDKFFDAIDRVKDFLYKHQKTTKLPGMWPTYLDYGRDRMDESAFTLGANADSLYEYLPKMHALLGGLDEKYVQMTRMALDAAKKYLLFRPMTPDQRDVLFSGDAYASGSDVSLNPEGQHLGCFVGGMYGLAGKLLEEDDYVDIGERLAKGCAWAYEAFPAGIMPEIFKLIPCENRDLEPCKWDATRWTDRGDKTLLEGFVHARDPRYLLRPEAIESIFYMYRITGKEEYRDLAWSMFQSIAKATETKLAYSAISSVTTAGETTKLDSMESFWFSETLKYFYLIFSPPDLISLDEYVFNTEAHPFRRPRWGSAFEN